MNNSFRAVAATIRGGYMPPPANHTQAVQRLYRKSLRLAFSWTIDRSIFLDEAEKLRARFEANRHNTQQQAWLLEDGERELLSYEHPDPYVICWMPGGSKFMRNAPPPLPTAYYQGDNNAHPHVPEDALTGTNTPVWPDMVPITFRPVQPDATLLVDFGKKNME